MKRRFMVLLRPTEMAGLNCDSYLQKIHFSNLSVIQISPMSRLCPDFVRTARRLAHTHTHTHTHTLTHILAHFYTHTHRERERDREREREKRERHTHTQTRSLTPVKYGMVRF